MKDSKKTASLQLDLTLEEVNIILKALGNLPFNEVYDIIGKIHDQANAQAPK